MLENNTYLLGCATLLGLLVGSFLNVVIYRVPVMLQRSWRKECACLLEDQALLAEEEKKPTFNLVKPDSTCPHCGHAIRPWENIPIISYLLQRGKCTNCSGHISLRYPLIEFATAIISGAVAWQFGYGWETLFALLFSWCLIALTMIDADHQLLPDNITLPLLWLGLIASSLNLFTDLQSAVIGAIAGYLVLWLVYWGFKIVTGKEGMGYGDFKLLAAMGAWMGWQMLPLIVLLSSLVGAVLGSIMLMRSKSGAGTPIPFGPYLAVAGWIAMMWGEVIVRAYLDFSGIT